MNSAFLNFDFCLKAKELVMKHKFCCKIHKAERFDEIFGVLLAAHTNLWCI